MKKIVLVIAGIILSATPVAPAFAAVPVVCTSPDHAVYDTTIDGTRVLTGCLSDSAWQADLMAAYTRANPTNILALSSGATVTLVDGRVDTCPWWFPMGCVIVRSLVR